MKQLNTFFLITVFGFLVLPCKLYAMQTGKEATAVEKEMERLTKDNNERVEKFLDTKINEGKITREQAEFIKKPAYGFLIPLNSCQENCSMLIVLASVGIAIGLGQLAEYCFS